MIRAKQGGATNNVAAPGGSVCFLQLMGGKIGDEMEVKPSERQEYYCKLAVSWPHKMEIVLVASPFW